MPCTPRYILLTKTNTAIHRCEYCRKLREDVLKTLISQRNGRCVVRRFTTPNCDSTNRTVVAPAEFPGKKRSRRSAQAAPPARDTVNSGQPWRQHNGSRYAEDDSPVAFGLKKWNRATKSNKAGFRFGTEHISGCSRSPKPAHTTTLRVGVALTMSCALLVDLCRCEPI